MEFIILLMIAGFSSLLAKIFEGFTIKSPPPTKKIFPPKTRKFSKPLHLKTIPVINDLIFSEPHFLIAGTTGSGKSTLLNRVLYSLIGSGEVGYMVLIDVKKVELSQWNLPCSITALTPGDALNVLQWVCDVMDARYNAMLKKGLKKSDEKTILIVIDEAADLLLSEHGKQIERLLQRIAQVGRAANCKLILCTQIIRANILTAAITANISGRIALRCRNALESRQIIGVNGAEQLPEYGYFLSYTSRKGLQRYSFEPMPEQLLNDQISKLKTL